MSRNTLKTASQKSGLTAHVIRAWEKRYGIVNPDRTKTNRRFYTDEEIEKLKLLKKATESGHSIGSISNLPVEKLAELVLGEEKESIFQHKKLLPEKFELIIKNQIEEFFKTAENYDSKKLQFLIYEIEDEFSQSIIIEEIILPILQKFDKKNKNGEIAKITEQFIINEFEFYLQQIIHKIPDFENFPLLISYAPVGGFQQIGSLISAAVAKMEKFRICNLGENINSAEIFYAIEKINPVAISINLTFPYLTPAELKTELLELKNLISPKIKILLSGRAVWNYREEVNQIGGIFCGDTFAFRKELQKIREEIKS